jgi:hypothetical protein
MPALVRFRFVRDLLVHVDGELQPRAYTAPFVYDLKLPVARLAVAGDHGDVVEIHGVDADDGDDIARELLALVPDPTPAPEELPPVPAAPTSDAVVIASLSKEV